MKTKTSFLLAILTAIAGASAEAQSVIDFSTLTPGTQITTQYAAQGVTFATEDADGNFGAPAIGVEFPGGLANTPDGNYPTTEDLNFYFTNPATVQSFTFNNYGENDATFYAAYDSSDTLIGSGNLSNVEGSTVTVNLANVSMLQFNNGTTVEGNNWEFVVGSITFNAAPVPEPSTLALAGLSGLGLLLFRRRK
jgi:hypothetical protein